MEKRWRMMENLHSGINKTCLIFTACAILSLFLIPVSQASLVSRSFSKTSAVTGENIIVYLTVSITAGETFYAIDDTYPAGWTIISAPGGNTSETGHVKFVVMQGATSTNHIYTIRTPPDQGTYTFSGAYMFENMVNDAAISGQNQVTVMYVPTDTTPPSIAFVPPTPNNNTNVTANYIQINVSLSEAPGTCSLNWYNGTWTNVSMTIQGLSCYRDMTGLMNYTYKFRVYATDIAGNLNVSATRQNRVAYSPPDTTPPTIQITSPTSNPTYSTTQSAINISGTASDNVGVMQVNWSNNRGGNGIATGTTSWSVRGITLYTGNNNITVIAWDAAGNTGTDIITVNYTQPCIDMDNDGYGNPSSPLCSHPEPDCNDSNANIHPGAPEICNAIDDNCNGYIDENLTGCSTNIVVTTNYYDGSTTNFSAINLSNSITGIVLEKLGAGKIVFRENVRFTQSVDLDSQTNISFNRVFINSNALPMLNKSATVFIYSLSFVNPLIQMDGSACPPSICTKVGYAGGILTFNVTHFSTYYAVEGPYCQDGSCNGVETCATCPQDCGQCTQPPPGGPGGPAGPPAPTGCINGQARNCSLYHKGKCGQETETCIDGNWTGCPAPSQEVCNKIDDNCNGQADEGLACECFEGQARPCGSNVGECKNGTRYCINGKWDFNCMGETKPSEEVCNEKDDNCDGNVDENCVPDVNVTCQEGMIQKACKCGDRVYAQGFCYSGQYSDKGQAQVEFPWITISMIGIIIILVLTMAIIYKEFHKKGKKEITWGNIAERYKSSSLYHPAKKEYVELKEREKITPQTPVKLDETEKATTLMPAGLDEKTYDAAISFIKEARSKGLSELYIKESLLQSGLKSETIDEILRNYPKND